MCCWCLLFTLFWFSLLHFTKREQATAEWFGDTADRPERKREKRTTHHFSVCSFFFLIVYAAQHSLNFPSLIMLSAYEILIRWRENIEQCTAKIDGEIIICIWCDQKYDCRMNMTQDGVDEKNKFLMGNQSVWWRLLFHFSSQTGQR